MKLRIFPNKQQKQLFRKCFGAHRYFYNKAICEINRLYDERKAQFNTLCHCVHKNCKNDKVENNWSCQKHLKTKLPWNLNISFYSIRAAVLKPEKELIKDENSRWQSEIPYDTREYAVKDAITAYKSCCSNKVRGNIDTFQLNFKRRSSKQIFWVDKHALNIKNNQLYIFPRRLKEYSNIRVSSKSLKRMPAKINHDAKIYYDRGAYYLIITQQIPTIKSSEQKEPIISLDPGVRTFMTGYSPTGSVIKIGEKQKQLMDKIHQRIDHLRSVRSKVDKRRTKWRLKQRLEKLERALFGMVDNLHNQTTAFLTRNFQCILLPTFGTSEMLKGDCLASSTKRCMSGLAHYRFQQKLIYQCIKHNCKLYLVSEDYTTKACGSCGRLKNIGGNKIYHCDHCDYTMDRDIHGSRNILLKTCSTFGV